MSRGVSLSSDVPVAQDTPSLVDSGPSASCVLTLLALHK